jgi:hypothetical protein
MEGPPVFGVTLCVSTTWSITFDKWDKSAMAALNGFENQVDHVDSFIG